MRENDVDRAFADAFVPEDEALLDAREAASQFGIEPVSPATGAALALAAAGAGAGAGASAMIEIGTGTGVSGLWLLRGSPDAVLTTIDEDLDLHQVARSVFQGAGIPSRRTRLITGEASEVLPRMNEGAYDLVVVDAGWEALALHLELALRLARPGGSVLVPRVLRAGRVADETQQDAATVAYRSLLRSVRERDDLLCGLSTVGDGLLHVVTR